MKKDKSNCNCNDRSRSPAVMISKKGNCKNTTRCQGSPRCAGLVDGGRRYGISCFLIGVLEGWLDLQSIGAGSVPVVAEANPHVVVEGVWHCHCYT